MKTTILKKLTAAISLVMFMTSLLGVMAQGQSGVMYDRSTRQTSPTNLTTISSNVWDRSNVKYWGAKGDGVVNDTVSIQNCIDAQTNSNPYVNGTSSGPVTRVVQLPAGVYIITNTILVPAAMTIRGDGSLNSIIRNLGTNTSVMFRQITNINYLSGFGIEGITISHAAPTAATIGIKANGIYGQACHPMFRDVLVTGAGTGIVLSNTINLKMENVKVQLCLGDGISLQPPNNAASIESCYSSGNGGRGWVISADGSTISGAASDSNAGGGWYFDGFNSSFASGLGAEENGNDQITFIECQYSSLNGAIVIGNVASSNGIVLDTSRRIEIRDVNWTPGGNLNGYALKFTDVAGFMPLYTEYMGSTIPSFGLGSVSYSPTLTFSSILGHRTLTGYNYGLLAGDLTGNNTVQSVGLKIGGVSLSDAPGIYNWRGAGGNDQGLEFQSWNGGPVSSIRIIGNGKVYVGPTSVVDMAISGNLTVGNTLLTNGAMYLPNSLKVDDTSELRRAKITAVAADPSLTGGANSGLWQVYDSALELAQGFSPSTPYNAWIQARHATIPGVGYPLSLNPLGGNVGVGTTNAAESLDVNGNASATRFKPTSTNAVVFIDEVSGTYILSISNGNLTIRTNTGRL